MKNSLRSVPATPEAMAEIGATVERILQQHGTEKYPLGYGNPNEPDMLSARVPIETSTLTSVPKKTADVNPNITIKKPIGNSAAEFHWAYAITYNMYNAQHSRHILIGKSALRTTISTYPSDMAYGGYEDDDIDGLMDDYAIAIPPHLTEAEARAIAYDLHNVLEPKTP